MSYTTGELAAVGLTSTGAYWEVTTATATLGFFGPLDTWLDHPDAPAHDAIVRLALAHPERAGEALGPGWRVDCNGQALVVDAELTWLLVQPGAVMFEFTSGPVAEFVEIPPEFDAALSRARLIAAAWARIEASSKRDPARPYCREPETCNGSCRRDPACCE